MMTEFGAHELTDEHMRVFRDAVRDFLKEFGITDWCYDFEWITDPENQALAEVDNLPQDRVALFKLNKTWTEKPTNYHLKRTAFHEVMELLLSPLRGLACSDWLKGEPRTALLNMEAHIIIRRLENARWGAW